MLYSSMVSHVDFFGCKHPIVCVSMNYVSDVNLAVAVHKAGGMPSLFLESNRLDLKLDTLSNELDEFKSRTNSDKVIVTIPNETMIYAMKMLVEKQVKFVELIGGYGREDENLVYNLVQYLRKRGTKVMFKQPPAGYYLLPYLDAVSLKGVEAAGAVSNEDLKSLETVVHKFKEVNPHIPIIATGGVATKKQIDTLLKLGAMAVGIGTLFAASAESRVSDATKQLMIDTSQSEIHGNAHNSFIIKHRYIKLPTPYTGLDDNNKSNSLQYGIAGEGGHIYAGTGVSEIKEILTVEQIINRLTQ